MSDRVLLCIARKIDPMGIALSSASFFLVIRNLFSHFVNVVNGCLNRTSNDFKSEQQKISTIRDEPPQRDSRKTDTIVGRDRRERVNGVSRALKNFPRAENSRTPRAAFSVILNFSTNRAYNSIRIILVIQVRLIIAYAAHYSGYVFITALVCPYCQYVR